MKIGVNRCEQMKDNVRKTVSFTEELELAIARRAVKYGRSFSAQVAYDMSVIIERAKHPRITQPVKDLNVKE